MARKEPPKAVPKALRVRKATCAGSRLAQPSAARLSGGCAFYSAPGHAPGSPSLWPASANPLGPRWPAMWPAVSASLSTEKATHAGSGEGGGGGAGGAGGGDGGDGRGLCGGCGGGGCGGGCGGCGGDGLGDGAM